MRPRKTETRGRVSRSSRRLARPLKHAETGARAITRFGTPRS
jgi:hypothetical protein